MRPTVVVLSSLAVACCATSGCSFGSGTATPIVPKTTLQDDIAQLVREAGVEPESVTCPNDLIGEVGQSTQCEVEASPADALLAPIVTVTGSDGSKVNWKIEPAMTQEQVERWAGELHEQHEGQAADSVSCESGLEGKTGSVTRCDISAGGVTVQRTIRVAEVKNLMMRITAPPILPRAQVEESLLDQLAQEFGDRPETARCTGDLEGTVGNTVECTVAAGQYSERFVLTVKSVQGNQILWEYAYKE